MRKLITVTALFCVMCLTGCPAPTQQGKAQQDDAEINAKIECVKLKKVINMQVSRENVILVMEDGTLLTVYVVHPHRTNAYIAIK